MEFPCEYCRKKNVPCGQKISASAWAQREKHTGCATFLTAVSIPPLNRKESLESIPWSLPASEEVVLARFEQMHIQSLRERDYLFGFKNVQVFRDDGSRISEWIYHRFGPDLSSSKPVRYGCILYSLYKHQDNSVASQRFQYLTRFYQSTQDAIDRQAYAELVYGCFAGCMYVLRTSGNFTEAMNHAHAFKLSVHKLLETSALSDEELVFLELMWEKVLWYMTHYLLSFSMSADLYPLAECIEPLFPSVRPSWHTWVEQSYSELHVKRRFLQLIYSCSRLYNYGEIVKTSLVKHFVRNFTSPSVNALNSNPVFCCASTRALVQKLWLELFALLFDLAIGTRLQPLRQSTIKIIESIHSVIDLIPQINSTNSSIDNIWNANDLATYCLVLTGLALSELQHEFFFGYSIFPS